MRTPINQVLNGTGARTPVSDILINKYQQEEQAKNTSSQNAGFTLPLLDLLKGGAKGVGSTIDTINKTIADPVYKKLGLETPSESGAKIGITEETLKPTNTAQEIGKGIEQVAEFVIPETAALKAVKGVQIANKALNAGAKALTSFGTGAGVSKLQGADNTEAGTVGVASAVIPPVVSTAFKILGSTLKGTAGALSGKGTKAIDAILDNPREALKGMSQEGIDTLKQNAKTIQDLGSGYYTKAKNEFEATLNTIKKKVKNIDSNAVNQKVSDILAENNITYAPNKKGIMTVDLSGFAGDNKALLKKTFDLIKGKANDTVAGVEEIAQIINKQKLNTNNVEIKTILGKMANAVRSSYVDQLNKMGLKAEAKIAETYAKAQDKLDTFDSMFGSDSRSKIFKESTLTDIMEKVKNLTSGDKTIQGDKVLDIGGDIKAILAKETGRQMKENITRAEGSIGGDTVGQMLKAVLPSKTVGQITAGAGVAKEKLQPILDFITSSEGMKTGTKQALINYVNSFLQE